MPVQLDSTWLDYEFVHHSSIYTIFHVHSREKKFSYWSLKWSFLYSSKRKRPRWRTLQQKGKDTTNNNLNCSRPSQLLLFPRPANANPIQTFHSNSTQTFPWCTHCSMQPAPTGIFSPWARIWKPTRQRWMLHQAALDNPFDKDMVQFYKMESCEVEYHSSMPAIPDAWFDLSMDKMISSMRIACFWRSSDAEYRFLLAHSACFLDNAIPFSFFQCDDNRGSRSFGFRTKEKYRNSSTVLLVIRGADPGLHSPDH